MICFYLIWIEGTDILFKLWGTRVAAPLNSVHFGYGVGAIIANLIVRPFFNHENPNGYINESIELNSTFSRSVSIPIDTDIRIPYLIAASSCILVAFMNLGFFIWTIVNEKKKQKVH